MVPATGSRYTPPMRRRPTILPAEELLHPWPLLAVVVLVVNDRLLKGGGWLPGVVTGKLSDVAGLFFFPLLLTALVRIGLWPLAWAHARRRPALRRWHLAAAIAATAVVFAAIQLSPWATATWATVVGTLDVTGVFPHVTVTPDPTDLLALPVLALTWWHGRRFCQASAPAG